MDKFYLEKLKEKAFESNATKAGYFKDTTGYDKNYQPVVGDVYYTEDDIEKRLNHASKDWDEMFHNKYIK